MQLNYRLLELFDEIVYATDFPLGVRAAVELRGITMGPARQPLAPGQEQDYTRIQRVLQCIISDFGLVDPPPGGCPVRDGSEASDVTEDRIAAITEAVLRGLREQGAG